MATMPAARVLPQLTLHQPCPATLLRQLSAKMAVIWTNANEGTEEDHKLWSVA